MKMSGKHNKGGNGILKKILFIIFLVICVFCIGVFIYNKIEINKNQSTYDKIEDIVKDKKSEDIPENVSKVIELHKDNSDVIGWIQIDDTIINYPLLQTTDNEYYLKHNYKREKSKYGSIYLKSECNFKDNNSNLIIYGHNMKDSQMFNSLLKYKDKEYYDNHKTIKIANENEEIEYEIVSVFKSRVFYQDEKNVFRYYNYTKIDNEQEYNTFINECKKIELYDTGVSAEYGEQLVTLITCEYSQENGRMVIVGKKIKTE